MKGFLLSCVVLFFVFQALTLPISAARFRDDMDRLDSSPAISYNNLALSTKFGVGNDSLFKISDPQQNSGTIVYRINNATKVSAVVYSAVGTQLYNDSEKSFFLADGLSHSPLTPVTLSTFFSPSHKEVYILPGGSPQRLAYRNTYGYYFLPQPTLPNDLINYTVSIYVSADGNEYSSLSLLRTSSEIIESMGMVKEEWSAFIPPNVTYLRVELNDFTKVFVPQQQEYEPRSVESMTMVAHVDIEGDGLIIGVPQPIEVSTGSSSSSSSSKEEKESSKTTSSKATSSSKVSSVSSSSASSTSTSTSVSLSPSSKFEGVVSPESSTKKTISLSAPAKFEGDTSSANALVKEESRKESIVPSTENEVSNPETFFFPAEDNTNSKNPSVFIIAYVVFLTAGILFALKNRTGSGK